MPVPLLDLKRQYAPLRDKIRAAMDEVCDSQMFIMGAGLKAFEAEVAAYIGCKYALGCASGSDALLLALHAIGLKPGDEVITTPFTFFATASAITRLGGVPVFADIDPDTYNIDPVKVERAITSKTKAILPVHLFGQCANMDALMALASAKGIAVVEDAAQSIGAKYKGHQSGNIGTVGCFSFFPSKNLGAFGDGGLVTTNDDQIAGLLDILRMHGAKPKYYHKIVGYNSRLDALQAAILRVKLPCLDTWHEGRRKNADWYDKRFAGTQVRTPKRDPNCYHIYNQYTIRVPDRDKTVNALKEAKIGCEIYYPVPLHVQECFAYLGYRRGTLPHAEKAALEVCALPIFPELTAAEMEEVASAVLATC